MPHVSRGSRYLGPPGASGKSVAQLLFSVTQVSFMYLVLLGIFSLDFLSTSTSTSIASAEQFLLGVSSTTILSGDIGRCPNATLSSCAGGVASANAIVRFFRNQGYDVLFVPYLDRQTAFAQMHPLVWGVNGLVFDYFGFPLFDAPPSLYQTVRGVDLLQSPFTQVKGIATNVIVNPDNDWFGFQLRTYVYQGRYGFAWMESQFEPNSIAGLSSAASAMKALARSNAILRAVVLADERWDAPTVASTLQQMLVFPSLFPHVIIHVRKVINVTQVNGTLIVGVDGNSATTLGLVNITFDPVTKALTNVAWFTRSLTLSSTLRDATFIADQDFLRKEALQASSNDPVVGNTSTPMPPGRNSDGSERYCHAGECPQGNLFTDAMRWSYRADIGITSSGGLRGPGWAAGPVKISNLWTILPFANTVCTVKLMGLKIFEILNFSSSLSYIGVAARTDTGDRMLQVSGVRWTVNPNINVSRLISVEVWDSAKQAYVPLERLKYYTVVADSFVCDGFVPFNTYMTPLYTGEGPKTRYDTLVQNIVADFMKWNGTDYNTTYSGRLSNSTSTNYMNWIETPANCTGDTYWVPGIATCTPCPAGHQPTYLGSTVCELKPKDNSGTIVAIVVPIAIVLVAALLGILVHNHIVQSKNVRNVANAPTGGEVTLMFTDIQDSTKLWGTVPASMAVALDMHHHIIRACIANHKGYEVKTVGDSFMIVFGNPLDAVQLARDVQLKFQETKFPAAIREVYIAGDNEERLEAIDDNPDRLDELDPLWNGIRVRIGLHIGNPDCQFDEVAKGYDYYGPPVNVSARVESAAKGGQILCSSNLAARLTDPASLSVTLSSVGTAELKGVADPMELFQIVPNSLAGRKFAKLGDEPFAMQNQEGSSHSDTCSMSETASQGTGMGFGTVSAYHHYVEPFRKFLGAMFKTAPAKDRQRMIDQLAKMWRISKKQKDEDYFEAIAKRVAPQLRKELEEYSQQNGTLVTAIRRGSRSGIGMAEVGNMSLKSRDALGDDTPM